jgi:hypothetical protein
MTEQPAEANIKNCLYYSGADNQITSSDGTLIVEDIESFAAAKIFIEENYGFNALGNPSGCQGDCTQADVMEENFPNYVPCPADLNGDGAVSAADLLEFLTAFGQACPDVDPCDELQDNYFGSAITSCPADFDEDGAVSAADLLEFLVYFGQVCGEEDAAGRKKYTAEGRSRCANACNIYDDIVNNVGLVVTERQVAEALGCSYTPCYIK